MHWKSVEQTKDKKVKICHLLTTVTTVPRVPSGLLEEGDGGRRHSVRRRGQHASPGLHHRRGAVAHAIGQGPHQAGQYRVSGCMWLHPPLQRGPLWKTK